MSLKHGEIIDEIAAGSRFSGMKGKYSETRKYLRSK